MAISDILIGLVSVQDSSNYIKKNLLSVYNKIWLKQGGGSSCGGMAAGKIFPAIPNGTAKGRDKED